MKPHLVTAKGVNGSGRIKHARLALLPRPVRLSYEDRVRADRGFLGNAEVWAKIWRDAE